MLQHAHHTPDAGQGYIWLAHRDPSSIAWQLAAESQALWQELLQRPHLGARDVEWLRSGSLLLARDLEEAEQLQARLARLRGAGITAQYLNEGALHAEEPALHSSMAGGLLVSSDSQLVRAMLPKPSNQCPGHTASGSSQSALHCAKV